MSGRAAVDATDRFGVGSSGTSDGEAIDDGISVNMGSLANVGGWLDNSGMLDVREVSILVRMCWERL